MGTEGTRNCRKSNAKTVDAYGTPLEQRFKALAHRWQEETEYHSSVHSMIENEAYQEIIKLGRPVVPLILRELEANLDHWFHALAEITGEKNLITSSQAGDLMKMRDRWLEYGRKNGYIRD